jgi:hypothetical protein
MVRGPPGCREARARSSPVPIDSGSAFFCRSETEGRALKGGISAPDSGGAAPCYNERMADLPALRRRFQFRLLTLLIGITIFAVVAWWCITEARIAQDRVLLLETIKTRGGDYQQHLGGQSRLPLIRRLCGDQCVVVIWRPHDRSGPSEDEIRARFPKVQILVASDDGH